MRASRLLPIAPLAAAVVFAAGAAAAPGADVLVIGDSLGVGMEPYLERELDGYGVRTDAEIGRGSAAGVDALAEHLTGDDEVIVFALGSNDDPSQPQALAASLTAANELAAGRCLVLATLEVSEYSGVPEEPLNEAIRDFANANANVRLVEWADVAAADPGILRDGGHATAEGYALRAALFRDAIESCDAPTPSAGGDGIPNPSREALAEGRSRPPAPAARRPEPVGRREAVEILADALASQIAIGALR